MEGQNRNLILHGIIFFCYGALVHLMLLKLYVRHAYAARSIPSFVHAPLLLVIVASTGGLSVAWLMLSMLERVQTRGKVRPLHILLRGGFYGVAATFLAVAASSILGSVSLSLRLTSHNWLRPLMFLLAALDVSTYAMGAALASVPYAFLSGVLGGAYVLAVSRREVPRLEPANQLRDKAKMSTTFGILSLIFALVPFLGAALGAAAIFYGIKALRESRGETSGKMVLAKAGVAMGGLCVFFWLFSLAVYVAASYGWFGNQ
jgi:hypothetical protein